MSLNSYLSCSYFPSARIRSMYVELPWWFLVFFLVYFILFRYFNLFLKWTYILFHLLFFFNPAPPSYPSLNLSSVLPLNTITFSLIIDECVYVCVCACIQLYINTMCLIFFFLVMYMVSKLVTLYWTARRWHIPKRS